MFSFKIYQIYYLTPVELFVLTSQRNFLEPIGYNDTLWLNFLKIELTHAMLIVECFNANHAWCDIGTISYIFIIYHVFFNFYQVFYRNYIDKVTVNELIITTIPYCYIWCFGLRRPIVRMDIGLLYCK